MAEWEGCRRIGDGPPVQQRDLASNQNSDPKPRENGGEGPPACHIPTLLTWNLTFGELVLVWTVFLSKGLTPCQAPSSLVGGASGRFGFSAAPNACNEDVQLTSRPVWRGKDCHPQRVPRRCKPGLGRGGKGGVWAATPSIVVSTVDGPDLAPV